MFNHAWLLAALDEYDGPPRPPIPERARLASEPFLPARLPTTAFLEREATQNAPRAIIRQLRRSPTPPLRVSDELDLALEGDDALSPSSPRAAAHNDLPPSPSAPVFPGTPRRMPAPPPKPRGWKEPQPFEVLRAIENKDIMMLMDVRDHAFHLLLRRTGDVTPLLHAMRIGDSHRDIAILLLGALSRWVNFLEDSDMAQQRTKILLKALRTNLKLAIDYGLQRAQSDLIPSFLQTLVMSEGERWVLSAVASVAAALRATPSPSSDSGSGPGSGSGSGSGSVDAKPVRTARESIRNFATRELGKAEFIATLEEYIANATYDLVMMAAWSLTSEALGSGAPIPTFYFARDDRVYKAFVAHIHAHRSAIAKCAHKRLRWQLRVLEKVGEGRNVPLRRKVGWLEEELDGECVPAGSGSGGGGAGAGASGAGGDGS
ncbi:hypothetical protein BOTBODRAFT_192382 [Botryobasidium botryosum FD-172 SS1]|uniref:Uncharacterized protein n=1 Tax=Botryobasidium botryosum (strain FD-172 SS1) TaxID=930990 RepID=A0A067M7A7_BOTB1|nr:hypothetical protein BOTBODRAFT_192382 [Botryobasidium botryosum FD-172 SS1]